MRGTKCSLYVTINKGLFVNRYNRENGEEWFCLHFVYVVKRVAGHLALSWKLFLSFLHPPRLSFVGWFSCQRCLSVWCCRPVVRRVACHLAPSWKLFLVYPGPWFSCQRCLSVWCCRPIVRRVACHLAHSWKLCLVYPWFACQQCLSVWCGRPRPRSLAKCLGWG